MKWKSIQIILIILIIKNYRIEDLIIIDKEKIKIEGILW